MGLWGQIKSDISKAGSNPRLLDTKMLENVRKYLEVAKIGAQNQYKTVVDPVLTGYVSGLGWSAYMYSITK